MARVILLIPPILALLASSALAQQPTQAQANAIRQSCRSDYQAHCASVPTGGSAALQCLKDNLASLSPACQAAVGASEGAAASHTPAGSQGTPAPAPGAPPAMTRREQAAVMRHACGGDFRAFCQGVQPGGGRALHCLADHQESLSPSCREALARHVAPGSQMTSRQCPTPKPLAIRSIGGASRPSAETSRRVCRPASSAAGATGGLGRPGR